VNADAVHSDRVATEAARDAAEDAVQYDYLTDTTTTLSALTGMTAGETAFVRANEHRYKYSGSAWGGEGPSPTAAKAEKKAVDQPGWTGRATLWPDPLFRDVKLGEDFLGRSRWYQVGGLVKDKYSLVPSSLFGGRALRMEA